MTRAIIHALETAEARKAEILGSFGGYTIVTLNTPFFVEAPGGDIIAEVVFPQHFTEPPHATVMCIVDPSVPMIAGEYPRVSSVVVDHWTYQMVENIPRYTGGRIHTTIEAPLSARGVLTWKIEGPANVGSTVVPDES